MSQHQSFSSYDFPTLTGQSRLVQLVCLFLEIFLVHSESSNLPVITFLFYSLLVLLVLLQVFARWYYNIDSRYDLRQLTKEETVYSKAPYAMALYVPLVLGFLTLKLVSLNEGFSGSLFYYASFLQFGAALFLNILEVYEVFMKAS